MDVMDEHVPQQLLPPVIELDGMAFSDLDGFYDEVSRKLLLGTHCVRNLDAFNDVLRGGFGTPEGGFVLRWKSSAVSRDGLGHAETARVLERRLTTCHPANVPQVQRDLEAARRGEGMTIFETLVSIIRDHGPGGEESEDGVKLVLD